MTAGLSRVKALMDIRCDSERTGDGLCGRTYGVSSGRTLPAPVKRAKDISALKRGRRR